MLCYEIINTFRGMSALTWNECTGQQYFNVAHEHCSFDGVCTLSIVFFVYIYLVHFFYYIFFITFFLLHFYKQFRS